MSHYTLRQLECFVSVAEEGSINAAATRMFSSASAISSSVTSLEDALDTQLLVRRKAHGVTLTPSGRFVLTKARRLLQEAAEMERDASSAGEDLRGAVTVGCYATLAPSLLGRLIHEYTTRYPLVDVSFVHGAQPQLLTELHAGKVDLLFSYDLQIGPELHHRTLYKAHANVVCSPEHPLAQAEELTLALLAQHPMIMLDMAPSRENTLRLFSRLNLTPRVRFRTSDFELTRSLVGRNLGWAILVQTPSHPVTFEGLPLMVRPLPEDVDGVSVTVAWPSQSRLSRAGTAMVQLAEELFGQETPVPH